ncbi:MAG: hypothetical protein M3Y87_22625 [Myxococcota bacterium]|nr:hypothetical protein [Myxococcota bacterium]
MIINDAGEACFEIVVIGTTDPLELVRTLHASAREDLRGELIVEGDPAWSTARFELSFAGVTSKERPVRAHVVGHRGKGLLAAASADLKKALGGADVVVVRAGTDFDDDLTTSSTMIASGGVAPDAIVVLEAASGTDELTARAPSRYTPRPTHTLVGEHKPLDVLKLAIKAVLSREAKRA